MTAPTTPLTTVAGGRDRYFDALRTISILWVVVYHMVPMGAQEVLGFWPAMGLLFAIAGSLMARSLDRVVLEAIRSRFQRLLPVLWLMAVIAVPLMFLGGWPADERPALWRYLFWILPLGDPPGSGADLAVAATTPLWYLRTYLWFVLLSPALLILFRWYPKTMTALPVITIAAVGADYLSLDMLGPVTYPVVNDFLIYLACWLIGFAHHEGALARLHLGLVVPLGVALAAGGTAWAFTHPVDGSRDFNMIPAAQALFSLGAVLLLLRFSPTFGWVGRFRPLDRFVTIVNGRAMVIYLWHNVAIELSYPLGTQLHVWRYGTVPGLLACAVIAIALTVLGMLALGWIEDVAAGRRPQLLPRSLDRAHRPPAGPAGTAEVTADGSPLVGDGDWAVGDGATGDGAAVPNPVDDDTLVLAVLPKPRRPDDRPATVAAPPAVSADPVPRTGTRSRPSHTDAVGHGRHAGPVPTSSRSAPDPAPASSPVGQPPSDALAWTPYPDRKPPTAAVPTFEVRDGSSSPAQR